MFLLPSYLFTLDKFSFYKCYFIELEIHNLSFLKMSKETSDNTSTETMKTLVSLKILNLIETMCVNLLKILQDIIEVVKRFDKIFVFLTINHCIGKL